MDKPLPAYSGAESFVFVCYAHADRGLVYPEIRELQSHGFRIWYDDGIAPGSEWTAAIADAIESCSVFLYLITPGSVASEHCRREVSFALEQQCAMLAVHLEETDVPSALRLSLSHRQAILKFDQTPDDYTRRLHKALHDAMAGHTGESGVEPALTIGDLVLDIASQRLIGGEEPVLLDPKDVSVLLHLAEASPGLVSTEELMNRSWPGSVVGDNVVHQVIRRLRRAFGDDARHPSYIETLPRRGYRLMQVPLPLEKNSELADPTATDGSAEDAAHAPAPVIAPPSPTVAGRPIVALAAAAIAILAVLVMYGWRQWQPPLPHSLAVLPFEDLSPAGTETWLGESIATELHHELSQVPEITVASLSASTDYRNAGMKVQRVANELAVAWVVDGTVRRNGNRIRVTLQLVSAGNLLQQWGDLYEEELDDQFNAEIEIARSAAQAIRISLELDTPTLQIKTAADTQPGTRPSLRDVFPSEPATPTSGFPDLEDVDLQRLEDMGDVQ